MQILGSRYIFNLHSDSLFACQADHAVYVVLICSIVNLTGMHQTS